VALKPVQVRLSQEHLAWLDRKSTVISRSDVIRLLIEDAIGLDRIKEQRAVERGE
jgi:hypothetical protein